MDKLSALIKSFSGAVFVVLLSACAYTPQPVTVAQVSASDQAGHRMEPKEDCVRQLEEWDGFTCWPAFSDFGSSGPGDGDD